MKSPQVSPWSSLRNSRWRLERDDGLRETSEMATPLRIHYLCRKNYTQKSSIAAEKRKYACLEEDVGLKTLQLQSNTPRTYDIKTDCMFCSESITLDIKTRLL